MKLKADAEVRIVVKVGARADNPINEAIFHQGDNARAAKASWREGSRDAHTDRYISFEHVFNENMASLVEPSSIVWLEILINNFSNGDVLPDRLGNDGFSLEISTSRRHLFAGSGNGDSLVRSILTRS